jgi:hypothetical protein
MRCLSQNLRRGYRALAPPAMPPNLAHYVLADGYQCNYTFSINYDTKTAYESTIMPYIQGRANFYPDLSDAPDRSDCF